MQRSTTREQGVATFSVLGRAALEKHVPEARTGAAQWHVTPGAVWVQWRHGDGTCFALSLKRHLDWVTGEAALSREPCYPESLPLLTDGNAPSGYRVRLGVLLHDEDRWWPAGNDAPALRERLDWMALQLGVKAATFFARHPLRRN